MGASQSKSDEKVFPNETPISFSADVVNQLEDRLESPETSPERQSTLDSIVRGRIQSELQRLKQEEEDVRQQIEAALEKENLDKEKSMTEGGEEESPDSTVGKVSSSTALMGDLEEIKGKIDKYHDRRNLDNFPEIRTTAEAVQQCYKNNSGNPLDCWRQVEAFKASVSQLEKDYYKSLH